MARGKKLFGVAFLVGAVLALAPGGEAQLKIRVSGNFPLEHSSTVAMEVFKSEVERLTRGKVGAQLSVDLFPAMQLGGAKENVDQVRAGTVMMTWVGVAYLSRIVPELEAVSLPFLFPDRETAFRVIDGPVGDLINRRLGEKGFVSLGYMELGSRHVTNNVRPIRALEDFRGLKIRLQPIETHLASFRALGANPVPIDIKELYSALQQGVVDGQENPYSITLERQFHEVQKHLTETGHFFDFIIIVANQKRFQALKPELQKAVRTAMDTAIASQRFNAARSDAAALQKLRERGMTFSRISPEVRAQLRRATARVADEVKKRVGADLVNAVLAEIRK